MRSHGIIETLGPNHRNFYPLPQSTANQYIRLRPYDLRLNPLTPDKYERSEVIGPYQIDDGKIWFGNNYYDGEAMRGVGALAISIGQPADTLFSLPPEVARYEVSAILVESGRVWVALDQFGEAVSMSPGALVQWNNTTHEARHYPLEFVVNINEGINVPEVTRY